MELIGRTLLERYRIERQLGRGGMAEVYLAWDGLRSTYLALKVLHEELAMDRVFIRRFQREAQTLKRLQHPNIVRFYGLEESENLAFMVLDYIQGKSLKYWIYTAAGPLKDEQIRQILKPTLGALQFAHQSGFIHCDMKPGNILIDESGRVLVSDFGISRMQDEATATMVGFGTPAYMAPEQVMGKDPTPQTDLYAIGVVLYEMLTGGERPFIGEQAQTGGPTSEKIRWEQVNINPPSLRRFNPRVTPELETVVMTCLAKNPEQRYASALALLNDLETALPARFPGSESGHLEQSVAKRPDNISDSQPKLEPAAVENSSLSDRASIPAQTAMPLPAAPQPAGKDLSKQALKPKISGLWNLLTVRRKAISLAVLGLCTIAILVGVFGWVRELTPKEPNDLMMEMTEGLVNKSETPFSLTESTPMVIPSDGNLWLSLKDDMLIAKIPAGEFQMGSYDGGKDEKPLHTVFLDDFWIDTTEVTNAQYEKCVAAGECFTPSPLHSNTRSSYYGNPEYSEFPVIFVAWRDAKAYCNWAGRRLPTEAEWEKAARGGLEEMDYPWGNEKLSCQLEADIGANYWRCEGEDTFRVGSFKANRYGLFDMAGNVWEWVSDWYDPNYYAISPAQNPTGPESGVINRVLRGGSFVDDAFSLRVASRHFKNHLLRFNFVGFRCAASITP